MQGVFGILPDNLDACIAPLQIESDRETYADDMLGLCALGDALTIETFREELHLLIELIVDAECSW